jgi:FkbM family methyltransferase
MAHFEFDATCQIPFLSELYERVFGTDYVGSAVELGGFDGITFSNVSGLARRGWRTLLIEPNPEYQQKSKLFWKDFSNVSFLETAIGDKPGVGSLNLAGALSSINYELFHEYSHISWSSGAVANSTQIKVQISTLDLELPNFLQESALDVLSIDTEGFEKEVFDGFTLEKFMPVLLIVELADFHPHLVSTRLSDNQIYEKILHHGYRVIYKDHINTCFLQKSKYLSVFN